MGRVTLIELSPRRPSDGVVVPVRLSHNARNHARFFGEDWRPAVASLPTIEMDLGFDGRKFGQGALPQVGALIVALSEDESWPALVWKGAACSVREAPLPADWLADPVDGDFGAPMPFLVDRIQANEGAATLTLVDVGRRLDRPLIERRFGTTGVALLDGGDTVDLRGRPVPTGWGVLRSVPGVLVDRLDNIWLFLDRPATGSPDFFDGGAAFSAGVARASLAALKANAPAEGTVDYALDADGLFLARPWTEPAYPFTADVAAAGPQAAADIAAAIVAARAGPPFAAGTVLAFATLHPDACGIYIDDERTIGTALDELVSGLGGFWRLDSLGQIVLGRLAPAAPVESFGPGRIVSIRRDDVVMPTRRRGIGWGRNNRVHSEGEIAGILLVDWAAITGPDKPEDGATRNRARGAYSAAETYQPGDIVNWPAADGGDGGGHMRVGAGPTTAVPPSNLSFWAPIVEAGDDGDPGSDGLNTATAYLYQRSDLEPDAPTGTLTYTFATGALTGTPGSGWAFDIPETDGRPLWVVTAVASGTGATDAIAPADWSQPSRLVEDGLEGLTGGGQAGFEVSCTAAGVVIAGQLPQTRQLRLFRGTAELTTTASWSISGVTGGTITVGAATGIVTLSGVTADEASATVTATVGGISVSFPVSARKVRDGAPAVGALFGLAFPTSASAAQVGISSEIALPADMELQLHLNAMWEAASGTVTCEFWFQVRVGGGAWSTVGSATSASASVGEPAFLSLSRTFAAAGSTRIVEARVMATNSNSAQTVNASAGPATANGVPA